MSPSADAGALTPAGLAAAAGALAVGALGPELVAPVLLVLLVWVARSDVLWLVVPDGAVLALGALAVGVRGAATAAAADPGLELMLAAVDGVGAGGSLWLVREAGYRLKGFDVLGLGDVKLGAALGLLLGLQGFALALFVASVGGLLLAGAATLRGTPVGKVPFGALLAPATLAVWLAGAGSFFDRGW